MKRPAHEWRDVGDERRGGAAPQRNGKTAGAFEALAGVSRAPFSDTRLEAVRCPRELGRLAFSYASFASRRHQGRARLDMALQGVRKRVVCSGCARGPHSSCTPALNGLTKAGEKSRARETLTRDERAPPRPSHWGAPLLGNSANAIVVPVAMTEEWRSALVLVLIALAVVALIAVGWAMIAPR
jgi:hypothetical protein